MSTTRRITRNPFLAAMVLASAEAFSQPADKQRAAEELVRLTMPNSPELNSALKKQRRMITVKTRTPDPLRLAAAQAKRERRQQRNLRLAQKRKSGPCLAPTRLTHGVKTVVVSAQLTGSRCQNEQRRR